MIRFCLSEIGSIIPKRFYAVCLLYFQATGDLIKNLPAGLTLQQNQRCAVFMQGIGADRFNTPEIAQGYITSPARTFKLTLIAGRSRRKSLNKRPHIPVFLSPDKHLAAIVQANKAHCGR